MEDRITAPNNRELQLLPAIEEISNLSQRLYRLVSNILEQPDDVRHVRSIVSTLQEKIAILRTNTDDYSIDDEMLIRTYDRPVEVAPTVPDDGKERVYWGPDDLADMKEEIVQETIERIRNEQPAPPEKEYEEEPDIVVKDVPPAPKKRATKKKVAPPVERKQPQVEGRPIRSTKPREVEELAEELVEESTDTTTRRRGRPPRNFGFDDSNK